MQKNKYLVLCVDRDDDLGVKAGIRGPIIGEAKNIKAAKELLLADASESDGNTIFEAVNVLRQNKECAEVATLTGSKSKGLAADKNIVKQLDEVLAKVAGVTGVYLVTDGEDDDQLIPIIQSRIPIVSKKMVIVKQSRQLEKGYYVFKAALKDPNFARLIFGLPGIILLFIAIFQDMGVKFVVFSVGIYLLLKGFGLEEKLIQWFANFKESTSIDRASFPLYIGSVIMFGLSIWSGFDAMSKSTGSTTLMRYAKFVDGFSLLFVIGAVLFLIGRMGDMHFKKKFIKIKRYGLFIVSLFVIWFVVEETVELIAGNIVLNEFIGYLVVAFSVFVIASSIVRKIYFDKYILQRMQKGMIVYNSVGEKVGQLKEIHKNKRQITIEKQRGKRETRPFYDVLVVEDHVTVRTTSKTQ